jgi:hypothetical protein
MTRYFEKEMSISKTKPGLRGDQRAGTLTTRNKARTHSRSWLQDRRCHRSLAVLQTVGVLNNLPVPIHDDSR